MRPVRPTEAAGGDGDDNGRAGCVAPDGSLIVAGATSGGSWPVKDAYQDKLKGPSDAVIAKLSPQPSATK